MFRQSAAILFLLVHLFNIGGYHFLFDILEQRASYTLETQLDNEQYTDDQLIEMKVPLPMPYQTNWSSFERYDGEIMIEGVQYNYVKRKVWNDTLILLCIPNHEKMKLNSAKEQFFSLVNDLEQNGDKSPASKNGLIKSITSDFQLQENIYTLPTLVAEKSRTIISNDEWLIHPHISANDRPPEIS